MLDLARTYKTAVQVVNAPVELSAGTGTVTVYPPPEGETEDNERGLSVLASAGETDLLITGDMDAAAERKLLEQWGFSDIEVLVAGITAPSTPPARSCWKRWTRRPCASA